MDRSAAMNVGLIACFLLAAAWALPMRQRSHARAATVNV
jgi:hypothetical protein